MKGTTCGGCKGKIPQEVQGKFLVTLGGEEVENCSERCAEKVFRSAPVRLEVSEMIKRGVKILNSPFKQQSLF